MTSMSKTVVFFGSGPVAAESLRLLARHCTIEAVITKPRPEHHHGPTPVIDLAQTLNLPIYTATNKRTLDELFAKRPVTSPLAILIDFGIIVSQTVIDYFPLGIINSHFSLLPEWRGADPITFSILSGQAETGVSLMLLTAGMDEGPLLAQSPYTLTPDITTPELTHDLIELSDKSLQEIIPLWQEGAIEATPQEISSISSAKQPTYSRKLTKQDSILDWQKPAQVLEREIRAFIEWPKSRAMLGAIEVIITKAHTSDESSIPGSLIIVDKNPAVHCKQGTLIIDRLKPAGKKEMSGSAFLAGYRGQFLAPKKSD